MTIVSKLKVIKEVDNNELFGKRFIFSPKNIEIS